MNQTTTPQEPATLTRLRTCIRNIEKELVIHNKVLNRMLLEPNIAVFEDWKNSLWEQHHNEIHGECTAQCHSQPASADSPA